LDLVVDANVLIKVYIPEKLSDRAGLLLSRIEKGEVSLVAPDLIYSEIGNTLWRKHILKELTASDVKEIMDEVVLFPLKVEPSRSLVQLAIDLGILCNIPVYDAMYLALAMVLETRLITADKKLVDVIRRTLFREYITWLGEINREV
jgi:predicted nucleic acid-binding protein